MKMTHAKSCERIREDTMAAAGRLQAMQEDLDQGQLPKYQDVIDSLESLSEAKKNLEKWLDGGFDMGGRATTEEWEE